MMTVGQLIEHLKTFDPELEVLLQCEEDYYTTGGVSPQTVLDGDVLDYDPSDVCIVIHSDLFQ